MSESPRRLVPWQRHYFSWGTKGFRGLCSKQECGQSAVVIRRGWNTWALCVDHAQEVGISSRDLAELGIYLPIH